MKPTAAPAHRTMAEVLQHEQAQCLCALPKLDGHDSDCRFYTPADFSKRLKRIAQKASRSGFNAVMGELAERLAAMPARTLAEVDKDNGK